MKRFYKTLSHLSICVLLYIAPHDLFAQAPDTLWTKTYGGEDEEQGWSVQQTSDGGYIIAGYSYSYGAGCSDYFLVKTDTNGDTLWTRTYGGSLFDECRSVSETVDGGYILAGTTSSFGAGGNDIYLVKTDASGDTVWTQTYGEQNGDICYSAQQTSDSGYIVAGYTSSFGASERDACLLKIDIHGNLDWIKLYGGADTDKAYAVQQTSDDGYIITGASWSFGAGDDDVYLIRTDMSGDTLWTRTYGGPSTDRGWSVRETFDGGYVVAGLSGSSIYLVKTDSIGDTLWTRMYGDVRGYGYSVQQTSDGGYIIVGILESFGGGNEDVYLIRTDARGDTVWTQKYDGSSHDVGYDVQITADGGYVLVGDTHSDIWLIKTAPDTLGITEQVDFSIRGDDLCPTVFSGPLRLPEGRKCKVFDITGRVVAPDKVRPGIYFIQIDGQITNKVVKVR